MGKLIETVEYDYSKFHLSIDCFWCSIKSGKLTTLEAEDSRWITTETLDTVDWLLTDKEVAETIMVYQKR